MVDEVVEVHFIGGPWDNTVRAMPYLTSTIHGAEARMIRGYGFETRSFLYRRGLQIANRAWKFVIQPNDSEPWVRVI